MLKNMDNKLILEINQIKKMMGIDLIYESINPIAGLRDALIKIGKNLSDIAFKVKYVNKLGKNVIKDLSFEDIATHIDNALKNLLDDEGEEILRSYFNTNNGKKLFANIEKELQNIPTTDPNRIRLFNDVKELRRIKTDPAKLKIPGLKIIDPDKIVPKNLVEILTEKWKSALNYVPSLTPTQKFLLDKHGIIGSVGRTLYVFFVDSKQFIVNIPGLKNLQYFMKLRENSIEATLNKLKSILANPDPQGNFSQICQVEMDLLKQRLLNINREETENYKKMIDFLEREANLGGQGLNGNEKKQYTEACNTLFEYLKKTDNEVVLPIISPVITKSKDTFIYNMVFNIPRSPAGGVDIIKMWKNFLERLFMYLFTGIPKKMEEWEKQMASYGTSRIRQLIWVSAILYFIHYVLEPILNGLLYIFIGAYEIGISREGLPEEGNLSSFFKGILSHFGEWLEEEDKNTFREMVWKQPNGKLLEYLMERDYNDWNMKKVLIPLGGPFLRIVSFFDELNMGKNPEPNLIREQIQVMDSSLVKQKKELEQTVKDLEAKLDSIEKSGQPVKIDSIPSVNVQDTATNSKLDF